MDQSGVTRMRWLPGSVVLSIVAGLALATFAALLLKPDRPVSNSSGIGLNSRPAAPAVSHPAPVGCGPVPTSTGPAASYARATITATPVVVPGQSVVVDARISDAHLVGAVQAPALYRDAYLQVLLSQHGAVLGELQPDPELNPIGGHAAPGDGFVGGFGGNVIGGGARYLQVAEPGCPAPNRPIDGLMLPAGSYQVVAVVGYSRSPTGAAQGQIVSAPVTTEVRASGGPDTEHAMITGVLMVAGGPAPGLIDGVPGLVSAYTSPAMVGPAVASSRTDARGNFTLTLDPGTYYLAGASPNLGDYKLACGYGLLRAVAGTVQTAIVGCPIP